MYHLYTAWVLIRLVLISMELWCLYIEKVIQEGVFWVSLEISPGKLSLGSKVSK